MSEILFRCVSRCRLKLVASFFSSLICLISPGMVLKRVGPEEQNELNLRASRCVALVVLGGGVGSTLRGQGGG